MGEETLHEVFGVGRSAHDRSRDAREDLEFGHDVAFERGAAPGVEPGRVAAPQQHARSGITRWDFGALPRPEGQQLRVVGNTLGTAMLVVEQNAHVALSVAQ